MKDTSWKEVGKWYDRIVAKDGHYFHKEVIFPHLMNWLTLKKGDSLLDLGCGQGVLARKLPQDIQYVGLDMASNLIEKAKDYSASHQFFVRDVTKPFKLDQKDFSAATFILSLQNIQEPGKALKQVYSHLKPGGKLILVLNHPCFRIPRQSHWDIDPDKKMQSRKVDRYLSPMEIPIELQGTKTFSFHFSLSDLCGFLFEAGFVISRLEEWISNKESTGKWAKMENRARKEFPLFLALEATKTYT